MLVAITGANGFIGRSLVHRFEGEGHTVRPVVRADIEGRNLDRLVAGADVVIHAAGATRAPTRAQLAASNVALTSQVIDASKRGGVGRFVFISSQAAAGPALSLDLPVTEATPPAPMDAYGRSKLDAERVVQNSGVPFVIVRPAAVYGPYDRDFLDLFRLARFGVAIHPGNRDQWISIAHVDDVARGVLLASTAASAAGGTFFVANDQPVQWRDLFAKAAKCADRRLHTDVEVPAWLVRIGAAAGDVVSQVSGRTSLLTSDKVALAEPRFWVCSAGRIRRELGYVAKMPLDDGFAETYRWYLEEHWL
ncbi:MAG: NAD-dependent epimerase/dehydratase family protein [Gemmatimonadaceae bacterium]